MSRLAGKVAIVTGAGSSGKVIGNGKATAILFAREGAKVLCADAVEDRARETVDAILKEGGTASALRADVSKTADCKAMVQAAVERYGRLDILDNNVGISVRADVLEVTEEQWDRVMAVNVKSIMLTGQIRGSPHDPWRRRLDHQHLLDRRSSRQPEHAVLHLQGRGHRHHALDGGRPWPAGHPRQLHRAGAGLRPDGGAAHGRGAARAPARRVAARHRGHRVGRCLGGGFSGERRGALDYRRRAASGRRTARREPGHLRAPRTAEILGEDDRAVVVDYWIGASCRSRFTPRTA